MLLLWQPVTFETSRLIASYGMCIDIALHEIISGESEAILQDTVDKSVCKTSNMEDNEKDTTKKD